MSIKIDHKIPEEWGQTPLRKICNINTGRKDVNEGNPEGRYPFFTCSRDIQYSDNFSFDTNAILIPGNGDISAIKKFKGKFEAYQRTYVLDNFRKNREYLFFFLDSFLLEIIQRKKIGTTIEYIRKGFLEDLKVFIPKSLTEQQKIAEILSTVDKAIEKTDEMIKKHQLIKKGLMQDLFTKGIDENGNIRSEDTYEFKDSPMGKIPKGWNVKNLGDLGNFSKGKNIPKKQLSNEGYPCVLYGQIYTSYDFYTKKLKYFISRKIADQATKIKHGDILFAGSGETFDEIGKCFSYLGSKIAFAGGDIIILTPRKADSLFLGFLLNTPLITKQKSIEGQGSSVIHIYPKNLARIKLALPKFVEQKRITVILSQIEVTIKKERKYKEKLEYTKKALMQDLLTGKVRVNNLIDNDETT